MHFDGAKSVTGNGAGVVLTDANGTYLAIFIYERI